MSSSALSTAPGTATQELSPSPSTQLVPSIGAADAQDDKPTDTAEASTGGAEATSVKAEPLSADENQLSSAEKPVPKTPSKGPKRCVATPRKDSKTEDDAKESTPTPSAPKSRKRSATKVKQEASADDAGSEDESPTKKPKGSQKKNVGKKDQEAGDAADLESPTKSPSKERKKKGANSIATSMKIPTNESEMSELDWMLVNMRGQSESWAACKTAWEARIGSTVGPSTLPNRYARIMANIAPMSPADQERLLAAYKAVLAKFENEKMALVKAEMERNGAEEYKIPVLEKKLGILLKGEEVKV